MATVETDGRLQTWFTDDGAAWGEVPGRLSTGPAGFPFLIGEPGSITLVSEWPRARKITVPVDVGEPRQIETKGIRFGC